MGCFRGMANSLQGKEHFNAIEFSNALKSGSLVAYQAVIKPVEGTILTVIRESSEEATKVSSQLSDLRELMANLEAIKHKIAYYQEIEARVAGRESEALSASTN